MLQAPTGKDTLVSFPEEKLQFLRYDALSIIFDLATEFQDESASETDSTKKQTLEAKAIEGFEIFDDCKKFLDETSFSVNESINNTVTEGGEA